MKRLVCPYCNAAPQLVDGQVIYPHRQDLKHLRFWQCKPCDAYVGCHQAGKGFGDGTRPLGSLANAELRAARNRAHAAFDPLWRSGKLARRKAYAWLSTQLGLPVKQVHIAEFDLATCERVVSLCTPGRAMARP